MGADEVVDHLRNLWDIDNKPTKIIISGGEPMMQQSALLPLLRLLQELGCTRHIETAGTIMPLSEFRFHVSQFVVSPKLENSGNVRSKRYKPAVLRHLHLCGAYFKFVVSRSSDFDEIDQIVKECNIQPCCVMIMPEGTTSKGQIYRGKILVKETLARGYGLSLRQHVLLWGNERKR